MSIDIIKEKLFESIKKELNTQENKEFIENEVLKPLIQQILDQMYPYFMWMGLFFTSMFLFILIILMLNIKVFIHNNAYNETNNSG
jgi:hypothetical protein